MKLYDPAVEQAAAALADRDRVGAIRSIEVRVLHPSSERQLAHAHLLPRPSDIPLETLAGFHAEDERLHAIALGPAAGAFGSLYANVVLGSIVHELAVMRSLAGDPWPSTPSTSGRRIPGLPRSPSTDGSKTGRGSPSGGTTCPTTRLPRGGAGRDRERGDRARVPVAVPDERPHPAPGIPARRRRSLRHGLPLSAGSLRARAPRVPRARGGRDRAAGRPRRGPDGHRDVPADHRAARRSRGMPIATEEDAVVAGPGDRARPRSCPGRTSRPSSAGRPPAR